jgi:predicted metal-dependent phosphoesterase TrpH
MPAGQPFTVLCQRIAGLAPSGRADMHIHTTESDGTYTPAQVVEIASRVGLSAVAITDHDALAGTALARSAASANLEVIAGVEVTAGDAGREVHLLGYFVSADNPDLCASLVRLRDGRRQRYREIAERLRGCGASIDEAKLNAADTGGSLGRRTLANLLYASGKVGSVREAFDRYLADGGPADVPKQRVPLDEAIALIRGAGGISSLAHPPTTMTLRDLTGLRDRGLQAVEADYPTHRPARSRELRDWATALGLAITGGSDCHGPDPPRRGIGCRGVSAEELSKLKSLRET